jgi:hypothetical protein
MWPASNGGCGLKRSQLKGLSGKRVHAASPVCFGVWTFRHLGRKHAGVLSSKPSRFRVLFAIAAARRIAFAAQALMAPLGGGRRGSFLTPGAMRGALRLRNMARASVAKPGNNCYLVTRSDDRASYRFPGRIRPSPWGFANDRPVKLSRGSCCSAPWLHGASRARTTPPALLPITGISAVKMAAL